MLEGEPVPYHFITYQSLSLITYQSLSLIGVVGGRGQEGACPLYWGRFWSWCGIRVKVKTRSGTNSAKMTQLVSEKGGSKELSKHRRA